MSAEQRSPDRAPSSRIRPQDGVPTGVPTLDPTTTADATSRSATGPGTSVPRHGGTEQQPLSQRIERTQLEATIAALERELLASERRRQSVIDQYERLLASREREDGVTASEQSEQGSNSLRRWLALGRR